MVTGADIIKRSVRSIHKVRSEIGESGNEAYFEDYVNDLTVIDCDITEDKKYPDFSESFIFGHPEASVFGVDKLGENYIAGSESIRISERNFIIDHDDIEFLGLASGSDSYDDDSITTTTLVNATNGSHMVFSVGSLYQSIDVGSDIQLSSTILDRVRTNITGSNLSALEISVTVNSRAGWDVVDNKIWSLFTMSGREPKIKLEDTTGSSVIHKIEAIFRQAD